MQKIKQGDEVVVIAGRDKGRRGKVLRVLRNAKRIVVDGINMAKKHVKPNPQKNETGGIKEIARPLDVSNVAIFNAATGKPSRVGIKTLEDGRKVRIFKSTGEVIDV